MEDNETINAISDWQRHQSLSIHEMYLLMKKEEDKKKENQETVGDVMMFFISLVFYIPTLILIIYTIINEL